MAAGPHPLRRGGVYHWRIRVPAALAVRIGRSHFSRTLRTAALADARSRARCWTAAAERVFVSMHVQERFPSEVADALLARYAAEFLRIEEDDHAGRSAPVSILPVADYRPRLRRMVETQAKLLREHGRAVAVMKPVDLDFGGPELAGRIGRFDAAVASGLSGRGCWPFGVVRSCTLETVAAPVPLLLVP